MYKMKYENIILIILVIALCVAPIVMYNGVGQEDAADGADAIEVKSVDVKTVNTADDPEEGYKVGDKYLDFVINSENGSGTEHLYVSDSAFIETFASDNEEMFGGADDAAESEIGEIDSTYQPWFGAPWDPPSGEIESVLFAVQAAIGALIIG